MKKNIYTQPEGYKNELKQNVLAQISDNGKSQGAVHLKWAIAASVLLLLSFGFWHYTSTQEKINNEEIYIYLEENIDELDEDIIYSMVNVPTDTTNITIDELLLLDNDEYEIY